jgi:hypothetical protein
MSETTSHAPQRRTAPDTTATSAGTEQELLAAQQADYVAFLHRHPWATDAYELGFVTGVREDYRLQDDHLANVDIPILMLDNDFDDPDLDRYVQRFRQYEPDIGVLGDAYSAPDATRYLDVARTLSETVDHEVTLIVVPKCRAAFDVLVDEPEIVLGYAMGYSDTQALDFTDPVNWRGQDLHLLGASPPKQYTAIQDLTQPTISGDPPANIVGVDWNGLQKVAYKGEMWTRDGWQSADHLSIRETVRRGLREIKAFWQARGVWPDSDPTAEHRPAVQYPDDPVFVRSGHDIQDRDTLEDATVVEYANGQTLAYESPADRAFIEHRHGCPPSIA